MCGGMWHSGTGTMAEGEGFAMHVYKKKQGHHIFGHHVFATYMVLKNLIYRPARPRSSPLFSSEKFAFVLSLRGLSRLFSGM